MNLGKSTNLSRPMSSSMKKTRNPKSPSDSKILMLYELTNILFIDYKQRNPALVAMGEGKGSKNTEE